ncbi:MAG: mechanosensitive ion channel family protein [Planctomycetia bacterium]|nr:mechanosensitive ion channel family protein [Planctomycetia bacterium]
MKSLPPRCRSRRIAAVVLGGCLGLLCGRPTAAAEPGGRDAAASLLAPADTSSPRDTLRGFCAAIDRLYGSLSSDRPTSRRENEPLIRRTLSCLDLTGIASSLAEARGQEAAVCLKEVLDRVGIPGDAAIPGDEEVAKSAPKRWRVPGTEIVIARVTEGPREGEYLFDADTVARSGEFFARVTHLPYAADAGSPGLHDLYVTVGGWMIPESFVRGLPTWAHTPILGETAWQWIAAAVLVACAAAVVLAARLVSAAGGDARAAGPLRPVRAFVFPLAVIGSALVLDYALTSQVRFTGDALYAAKLALRILVYTGVIGIVVAALHGATEFVIRWRRIGSGAIEGQLVRLGCKVTTFLVVSYLVIVGADSLGLTVTPLVAGLSVSGLAFALAAQYTVENLIAGIVIFIDKPVRIGDECQYGDVLGTVERIGLRSTRIRCVDRTLVTVPNAEFAKEQLVNHGCRDRFLLRHVLRLPPDAAPGRIRRVLEGVRTMLTEHGAVADDSVRVRLVACGGDSVDVEVFAYVLTREHPLFLEVQEEVLFRIMEIVADSAAGGGPVQPTLRTAA